MVKEKKRKGKKGKGTESDRDVDVYLAPTVEFLHGHITEALCNEVFQQVRTTERQRKWTLFALARFWLAVILKPPASLSQVLERTRRLNPRGFLPSVAASAESFFEKCKNLSSAFFMALYHRFLDGVLAKAPKRFCQEVHHLGKRFSDVLAIDGSRLDKIAHRLKITWKEKAAILPGCLTAVYDLFRGVATELWFDADAGSSEFKRGMLVVETLRPESLLLGDRLYCSIQLFQALNANGSFGVFRRNKTVKITKVRQLSATNVDGARVEDWLVEVGKGDQRLELRLIVLKQDGKTYEAVTNVLDPKRLSAEDVVRLYPLRWTIERLFYDLKDVLNLKRFYAANPNAVAMQVYAAAIVHVAFRIAQANVAEQIELPPEDLSPKKLFPHLALVSIALLEAEWHFEETCKVNPGVELRKPSWKKHPDSTRLSRIVRALRASKRLLNASIARFSRLVAPSTDYTVGEVRRKPLLDRFQRLDPLLLARYRKNALRPLRPNKRWRAHENFER